MASWLMAGLVLKTEATVFLSNCRLNLLNMFILVNATIYIVLMEVLFSNCITASDNVTSKNCL